MSDIRLAVALPVRNGANYLAEALESVLAQSFGDFELFVSDNASTDATPDILADFARRDRRLRFDRSATGLTQVENTNRAMQMAGGDWVKLFCHDDIMQPGCMAEIYAAAAGADARVGLIGNNERHLFSNGYITQQPLSGAAPVRLSGPEMVRAFFDGSRRVGLPALTTATVRRQAYERVGPFDGRYVYFDTFYWLELLTAWDYVWLPDALTVNRIHGSQVAAKASRDVTSYRDYRAFVPAFLARHGDRVPLSGRGRMKAQMRPFGEAATKIACEVLSERWYGARSMLSRLPVGTLPLVVPLSVRSYFKERKRTAELRRHVPRTMIYP